MLSDTLTWLRSPARTVCTLNCWAGSPALILFPPLSLQSAVGHDIIQLYRKGKCAGLVLLWGEQEEETTPSQHFTATANPQENLRLSPVGLQFNGSSEPTQGTKLTDALDEQCFPTNRKITNTLVEGGLESPPKVKQTKC